MSSSCGTRNRSTHPAPPMKSEPLFSTRFPAPPRRLAPSLNGSAMEDSEGGGSITFRQADSTSRSLAALAQAKYEKMERRRASLLLVVLLGMAVMVHLVSTGGHYLDNLRGMQRETQSKGEVGPLKDAKKADYNIDKAALAKAARQELEKLEEEKRKEEEEAFLSQFSNLEDYSSGSAENTVGMFWHIPRAGGSSIKNILGQCLGLVTASEVGVRDGHGEDPELAVIDLQGVKFVNVDTTSVTGIERAKQLGLASSGLADVIVSSYLLPATQGLFGEQHKGRAFTLFRDPIERAVSMYYYKLENGMLNDISLEEYAKGNGIENNWMTRYLVNKMEGELTMEHLEQAKIVFKKKFLVGLLDDLQESIQRFMKYNGWNYDADEIRQMNQENCIRLLAESGTNRNEVGYDTPKKGSQAYALITWQNQFDLKLYEFARDLFESQTKSWGTKERKKADRRKKKMMEEE